VFVQIPWYSVPDSSFPPRARRRRKTKLVVAEDISDDLVVAVEGSDKSKPAHQLQESRVTDLASPLESVAERQTDDGQPSELTTPLNCEPPSEIDSTHPTTPSSVTQTTLSGVRAQTRPGVAIPLKSAIPRTHTRQTPSTTQTAIPSLSGETNIAYPTLAQDTASTSTLDPGTPATSLATDDAPAEQVAQTTSSPPIKAAPTSWAALLKSNVPLKTAGKTDSYPATGESDDKNSSVNGIGSMANAITSFTIDATNADNSPIAFLKPRGLVNTGNMCYMNAVSTIAMTTRSKLSH
jgi:ubiquitin carboxyl-terminal hydrolase 10